MSTAQTAALNLTDYEARVFSRVIDAREATAFLPAGTVQWKSELWNKCDDRKVDESSWEACMQWAWVDAERMFDRLRGALEKAAELEMAS